MTGKAYYIEKIKWPVPGTHLRSRLSIKTFALTLVILSIGSLFIFFFGVIPANPDGLDSMTIVAFFAILFLLFVFTPIVYLTCMHAAIPVKITTNAVYLPITKMERKMGKKYCVKARDIEFVKLTNKITIITKETKHVIAGRRLPQILTIERNMKKLLPNLLYEYPEHPERTGGE